MKLSDLIQTLKRISEELPNDPQVKIEIVDSTTGQDFRTNITDVCYESTQIIDIVCNVA